MPAKKYADWDTVYIYEEMETELGKKSGPCQMQTGPTIAMKMMMTNRPGKIEGRRGI